MCFFPQQSFDEPLTVPGPVAEIQLPPPQQEAPRQAAQLLDRGKGRTEPQSYSEEALGARILHETHSHLRSHPLASGADKREDAGLEG